VKRSDFLVGAVSSLAVFSLSGCHYTKMLWADEYLDTALAFLVTEDGTHLVVLGEKYHYVFDQITPSLQQVLLGPLRTAVTATLSGFYVTRDNVVTGDYTLTLSDTATDQDRRRAIDAGFTTPALSLSGHLQGVRYIAKGFPASADAQQFTRRYTVSIREQDPRFGPASRTLLTPVALAADGTLMLGAVVLVALMLAIVLVVPGRS